MNKSLYENNEFARIKSKINSGLHIGEVSVNISWQNFENLVTETLHTNNFDIVKNFIMVKPRMEIDIIGTRLGTSLLIDCKHWKKYNVHKLKQSVEKQVIRSKRYVSLNKHIIGIPIIVTLYELNIRIIDDVPIIPISRFTSFINEFYDHLNQIKTISMP
ncbi:MAG: hypothetical protein OXF77_00085 [Thaumarchaeota archaeon]|nr:hypothetical protein [Nitrososphaerota archaeon]